MKPRKTGFPYPRSGRKYLYPRPLALLMLSLASTLTCVSLSGCAAYTTANIQSAGSRILSPSPTSVSFGNVSVGNSSLLAVTLSNNGNSNVTISGVNTAGAGYGASGVSANTTLAPCQTATLNVVFAPTAAGSVSGSVSVASNAGNSPATISLSGSGVAQTTSSGAPTCGKSGDSSNHVPTDWSSFVPPAKGQSYVDVTFGCTVTRLTDASSEVWSGSFYLPLGMGYATVSPFNADDSYLMLGDGWGRRLVTDLTGNVVVPIGNVPGGNDGWYLWDATNAKVFYYTNGNSLMRSEEHTSELQSHSDLVCRLLLEKKKKEKKNDNTLGT